MKHRTQHSATRVGVTHPRIEIDLAIDTSALSWQSDAACVGSDPDSFFPDGQPTRETLRICNSCPAFAKCLAYALDHPELGGIWAATTREERHRMRQAHDLNTRQVWRG